MCGLHRLWIIRRRYFGTSHWWFRFTRVTRYQLYFLRFWPTYVINVIRLAWQLFIYTTLSWRYQTTFFEPSGIFHASYFAMLRRRYRRLTGIVKLFKFDFLLIFPKPYDFTNAIQKNCTNTNGCHYCRHNVNYRLIYFLWRLNFFSAKRRALQIAARLCFRVTICIQIITQTANQCSSTVSSASAPLYR